MKAGEDAVSGSEGVYGMSGGYFEPTSLTPQQQAGLSPPHHYSHPTRTPLGPYSHAHSHSTHTPWPTL